MLTKRCPIVPPAPGIHPGVPMEIYQRWGAVSASMLKQAGGRMADLGYWLDQPPDDPTPEMRLGTAFHVACLEPERSAEIVEVAQVKRNSPAAVWARAAESRPGRTVVCSGWREIIESMRDAVLAYGPVGRLLAAARWREASMVWEDRTGLLLRGRLDAAVERGSVPGLSGKWAWYLNEGDVIVDLKATRSAVQETFEGDVYRLGYHLSAAQYAAGYEHLTGRRVSAVVLVACEWARPHAVACYALGAAGTWMQIGRSEVDAMLARTARCYVSGEWRDGADGDLVDSEPPGWVVRRFEDGVLWT